MKNSAHQKLCFLTAGRMDLGLITPLLNLHKDYPGFDFQIVTMSAHNADGFYADKRDLLSELGFSASVSLKTLAADDNARGIAATLAATATAIAGAFESLGPDLVIIPGDRYEMMACASVASVMGLPIAHLYGGDVSYGAFDESFRHAITKLSHLHFVTNEDARRRVIQMGEDAGHVYNFGAPALDLLEDMDFMTAPQLEAELGIRFGNYNLLVTYHPTTLSDLTPAQEMAEVLHALSLLPSDHNIFFTTPGPDNDGRRMQEMIEAFAKDRKNAYVFSALGSRRYLSFLKICDMVLGNSSSGFYEAPSFKIPTVNIGDRQKGRMAAASVFHCACEHQEILKTISQAKTMDFQGVINPYYRGHASRKILDTLAAFESFKPLLHKKFHMAG